MSKSNAISKLFLIFLGVILALGLSGCGKSADELAAEAVDEAILGLPETVVLGSEDAIVQVRTAYDALTEAQKALVVNLEVLVEKEGALAVLIVNDLIAGLPETVTLANEAAVQAARTAYDALSAAQKALITNLAGLTAKEAVIAVLNADLSAANFVINKIDDLPSTISLTDENAVAFARAAFNALSDAQELLVTNLADLVAAEAAIVSLKTIDAADDLLLALPSTVALEDETQILAARAVYEALSGDEKAAITNYPKLTSAETALAQLKADAADVAAATAVDGLILNLPPTVELTHKTAVEAARSAYEALTTTQKALVSALTALMLREERIANLEAAQAVNLLINALPEVVTTGDETAIIAARTAFDALSDLQKDFVSNQEVLEEKERDLAIAKNPDLAVLFPAIEQVPEQITSDFDFPKTGGVVWTYKAGQDTSLFDLEAGTLLVTTFGVAKVTLLATYNLTSLEINVDFGLLQEGQKAIFYTGATKPAEGNTWDGFGTFKTQMEVAGFGGYTVTVGNNVYFISKDAYIPISGTVENEKISRETLRPLGLTLQTDYNNNGLKNGVAVNYSGAGALYQNNGSVAVTFDASDTYGRPNVPTLSYGYGKIMFTQNEDGTYTVMKYLDTHGGGDSIGSQNLLTVTLQPGDFLWCPHTWDIDYTSLGYGTRLCQKTDGVLLEGTIIEVEPYKLPPADLLTLKMMIGSAPEQITVDTMLPQAVGAVWSYKAGEDDTVFDLESGELNKLSTEYNPVVLVLTVGSFSEEVTVNFGVLRENETPAYYENAASSLTNPVIGWNGYTINLPSGLVAMLGEKALIELRAMESGELLLPLSVLQPYTTTPVTAANVGIISNGQPANPGYGAMYHNGNATPITFNSKDIYGYQGTAYGHSLYGYVIIGSDGLVKANLNKDTLGGTAGVDIVLQPGEYLWCPHVYDKDRVTNSPFAKMTTNVNFEVGDSVVIEHRIFKTEFPAGIVEALIAALPATLTDADIAKVEEARAAFTALTEKQKLVVSNQAVLETAEAVISDAESDLAEIAAAAPAQILADYALDTLGGTFAWSYQTGEDASLFDLSTNKMLIQKLASAPRILVVSSVQFPSINAQVTVNFGITPVGVTPSIYGTPTVPVNLSDYTANASYVLPFMGYTMMFTAPDTSLRMHFVMNYVEVTGLPYDLKPVLANANMGVLYANLTGAELSITWGDVYATSDPAAYEKLIIDATGKVTAIVGEFLPADALIIPAGGYLWSPGLNDLPGSADSCSYDMRTGLAVNDVIQIQKGLISRMFPGFALSGSITPANILPTMLWNTTKPAVISTVGLIITPLLDTEVTLSVTINGVLTGEAFDVLVLGRTPITVAEAIAQIDANPGQILVVDGIIIGVTEDGYYYIADATGSLYIRAKYATGGLSIGDSVRIRGTGTVYLGYDKQYVRQISGNYSVALVDGLVHVNPLSVTTATFADLPMLSGTEIMTPEDVAAVKANAFYGKYLQITGYLTIQGSYNDVYLTASLDEGAAKIGVYYQSVDQEELKLLVGRQVTLGGVIYNYHGLNGWSLGYLDDFSFVTPLTDLEKENYAKAEIEQVVTEAMNVTKTLAFFTATEYENALPETTYAFSSSQVGIIANNGTFTAPAVDTAVVITIVVTFSETHNKTFVYNVTAKPAA